jgi:hypothetical protein
VGFRIETYQEAKALGLEHLWPSRTDKPGNAVVASERPETDDEPRMNGLETAFWKCLQAGPYREVYPFPFNLRLAGSTYYKIDFGAVPMMSPAPWDLYEVKGGHAWDDAIVKLKVAAERYPAFRFYLVRRPKKVWTVQSVTCRGISRKVWCPNWLQ